MAKLIILGSKGFIGSWLFKQFSADESLEVKGFSSVDCDLLSSNSIYKALSFISFEDTLIVLSGITRLKENSYASMSKNIEMIENLSNFIANNPIKQIIFFSSVDVYGLVNSNIKLNEKFVVNPSDYYSISKLVSEYLLKIVCFKNNIPLLIFRLAGVYGPGDNGKSTMNKLVKASLKGKVIIFNNGTDKRDFIYVNDIYKLVNSSLSRSLNMTLNVATGNSHMIYEIVDVIKRLNLCNFVIENNIQNDGSVKRVKDLIFDISLLETFFPDLKLTNISEGLKLYLNEFR